MNDRSIILIEGDETRSLKLAQDICQNLDTLYLKNHLDAPQYLGQEYDAVIFNSHHDFSANAFGSISGTIRDNGFLILLKPKQWPTNSLFLKRFHKLLTSHLNLIRIDIDDPKTALLPKPPNKPIHTCYATQDQRAAVEHIKKCFSGHRRRPLLITSDRGRGKSAALGIAAAQLWKETRPNIIICAPGKKSAQVIFTLAKKLEPECQLTFYAPDKLRQQKPSTDLLFIDEAAAIPIPILMDLLAHYPRIVFATTQHGYEGCGRGFRINFQKELDQQTPGWKLFKLNTPVRWSEQDSLEQFTFDSLLLNTDPPILNQSLTSEQLQIKTLDKSALVSNETLLRELCGLLVSAHYQTRPSDFQQMLDDPAIAIHAAFLQNRLIGVALTMQEGGFEKGLATAIFSGLRRPKGHLVAQALSANIGLKSASSLKGMRINRIAIHPNYQRQGVGSQLLAYLHASSGVDYLSSSFGATPDLINFWQKSGFYPVYLGMKRDASSGSHSVIMLNPKTSSGERMTNKARHLFSRHFPHLLSDPFRFLEDDIALSLLSTFPRNHGNKFHTGLLDNEKEIVVAFAQQQRGYENSLYPIWAVVQQYLTASHSLEQHEKKILLLKVLQKQSWQETITNMSRQVTGKKAALKLIRQAMCKLLAEHPLV